MKTKLLTVIMAFIGSIPALGEYTVDGSFYGISLGMNEEAVRKVLIEKGYTVVVGNDVISKEGRVRVKEEKWLEAITELTKKTKVCAILPAKGNPSGSAPYTLEYQCKSPANSGDLVDYMRIAFYNKGGAKSAGKERVYFLILSFDVKHKDAKETAEGIAGKFGKSPGFFKEKECPESVAEVLKVSKDQKGSCYVAGGYNIKRDAIVEIHGYGKKVDSSMVMAVKLIESKTLDLAEKIPDADAEAKAKKLGF